MVVDSFINHFYSKEILSEWKSAFGPCLSSLPINLYKKTPNLSGIHPCSLRYSIVLSLLTHFFHSSFANSRIIDALSSVTNIS